MPDFSNREVTTIIWYNRVKDNEPESYNEWYEVRYCPADDWIKFKDDIKLFQHLVLDWGDDFKVDGKDWNCTEKNKEKFYWKLPDRSTDIIKKCATPWTFSTKDTEVKQRLGKSQSTKEPGKKPNHSTTRQTVADA